MDQIRSTGCQLYSNSTELNMILIAIVLLASLVYLWKQYKYSFWRRYNVPGPDPSFLVGNLGPVIFQKEHIGLLANDWYK